MGVALVDRVNYTTFWPMVPSVIPRNVEVRHVAHSLRRIVTPLGAEFFQREVTGVNFEAREVRTDKGSFPVRLQAFATPGEAHTTRAVSNGI